MKLSLLISYNRSGLRDSLTKHQHGRPDQVTKQHRHDLALLNRRRDHQLQRRRAKPPKPKPVRVLLAAARTRHRHGRSLRANPARNQQQAISGRGSDPWRPPPAGCVAAAGGAGSNSSVPLWMASVANINEVLEGHVALEIEYVDRLILNAYVPAAAGARSDRAVLTGCTRRDSRHAFGYIKPAKESPTPVNTGDRASNPQKPPTRPRRPELGRRPRRPVRLKSPHVPFDVGLFVRLALDVRSLVVVLAVLLVKSPHVPFDVGPLRPACAARPCRSSELL